MTTRDEIEQAPQPVAWAVGQVWAKGPARWHVERVDGDRAVLRSVHAEWATTRPLTMAEHQAEGPWTLVDVVRAEAPQPAPSQPGDVRAWGERVAHEAYQLGEDHASSYERGGGVRRLDAKAMERIFDEAGPAPQPAPSEAVAMAIAEDVVLAGLEQMHSPPSKEDLRAIVRRHLAASGEATAERERALVRAGAKLGARRYNGVPPAVGDAECDAIREAVRS